MAVSLISLTHVYIQELKKNVFGINELICRGGIEIELPAVVELVI